MKFYEKLIILCVIFIGVCITTAGIIGKYISVKNDKETNPNYPNNSSLIISNINLK